MSKYLLILTVLVYSLSITAAEIGSYVTYRLHTLGPNDTYITEKIVDYDSDLDFYKLDVFKNKNVIKENYIERSSIVSEKTINFILKNCKWYGGTIEKVSLYETTHQTCKITTQQINGEYIVKNFLDVGVEYYDGILWIGKGPYNGIFKYQRATTITNRSKAFTYIIQDFGLSKSL